jgi:hypothetical protein
MSCRDDYDDEDEDDDVEVLGMVKGNDAGVGRDVGDHRGGGGGTVIQSVGKPVGGQPMDLMALMGMATIVAKAPSTPVEVSHPGIPWQNLSKEVTIVSLGSGGGRIPIKVSQFNHVFICCRNNSRGF